MQQVSKEVKSRGLVVGTATFPVYDSVQEAVDAVGELKCLSYINAQVKANAMNAVRAETVGTKSRAKLQLRALARIPTEELAALAGDEAALEKRISQEVDAMLKEQAGQ